MLISSFDILWCLYVSTYKFCRIKTLLLQGFSKSEFYGDLVCKLRKIIGKYDFAYHFKKIIVRYKKNLNFMATWCISSEK